MIGRAAPIGSGNSSSIGRGGFGGSGGINAAAYADTAEEDDFGADFPLAGGPPPGRRASKPLLAPPPTAGESRSAALVRQKALEMQQAEDSEADIRL